MRRWRELDSSTLNENIKELRKNTPQLLFRQYQPLGGQTFTNCPTHQASNILEIYLTFAQQLSSIYFVLSPCSPRGWWIRKRRTHRNENHRHKFVLPAVYRGAIKERVQLPGVIRKGWGKKFTAPEIHTKYYIPKSST